MPEATGGRLKQTITSALKRGLRTSGHYARTLSRARFPGVVVLAYHGLRGDDWPCGSMAFENLHVRASTFAAHCDVVREMCHPISLDDWRASLDGGAPLPPRPVLITFDDGYRSVYTMGAPILNAMGLPAVAFVCSGPMQERALLWFDAVAADEGEAAVDDWKNRDYAEWLAVRRTPHVADDDPRALMTSDDLRALSRQPGIEVGAHTVSHPILSRAPLAAQCQEIGDNRRTIEAWIQKPVRAFAYPNGRPGVDYTPETVACLRESGFDCAFTTRSAFATPVESAFERSRFTIVSEVSAAELAHRLAYAWPR